jgi:hypothetical protein
MCRELKRVGLRKKNTLLSSQAATYLVQKLRREYWKKVKKIALENLVFISGNGVLFGLSRKYARSPHGTPSR